MATPMHSLPGDGSESSWHRTDAQRVAAIILLIERL